MRWPPPQPPRPTAALDACRRLDLSKDTILLRSVSPSLWANYSQHSTAQNLRRPTPSKTNTPATGWRRNVDLEATHAALLEDHATLTEHSETLSQSVCELESTVNALKREISRLHLDLETSQKGRLTEERRARDLAGELRDALAREAALQTTVASLEARLSRLRRAPTRP